MAGVLLLLNWSADIYGMSKPSTDNDAAVFTWHDIDAVPTSMLRAL